MCGIAGIMQVSGRPLDGRLLESMTGSLAHRGPDGEGYVLLAPAGHEKPLPVVGKLSDSVATRDGLGPYRIGLGHRRLAIIDLTPLGHQPMGSDDGHVWITYNGEVYNAPELRRELSALGHRFRSSTDTEVVLESYRRWGRACLSRLNGMFAFALWDGRARALFCARDRFGIKPFYYRRDDRRFLFASEIKALLQDSSFRRIPNDRIVYDYLTASRQDHTTDTFFHDVHQLAPGEWLMVREAPEGRLAVDRNRWWSVPEGTASVSREDAAAGTRERLEDAVRLALRADVPVGSCLSGGLDSSSIVCLMSRLLGSGASLRTFSSCHEDPRFDERSYIRTVLGQTGVANEAVFPDPTRLFNDLSRILWHQEEPFAGTSILAQWAVMQAAGGAGMKVLLDGQGADELLCGYPGYVGSRMADLVRAGQALAGVREWAAWRRLHGGLQSAAMAGFVRGLLPSGPVRWLRSHMTGETEWLDERFVRDGRKAGLERNGCSRTHRTVLGAHVARSLTEDLPALLHYEDRNSMAFSVEARVPFLDHRLVEWLVCLPPELKLRQGMTKVVLREAMAGILPDAVRMRTDKMGFVTPEDRWLRVDLRQQIETVLASDSLRARPYWRAPVLQDRYRRYCDGKAAIGPAVWRWVNLEWWLRRFCD
jgi:asparagine synthase (glutamine-hydrolysing)